MPAPRPPDVVPLPSRGEVMRERLKKAGGVPVFETMIRGYLVFPKQR